jgi:hypothetical protein
VLNDNVIRFFGGKWCLNKIFFSLTISKWDILKTDHWKNVSYHISLLISNFFILNGEILTKTIWYFLIPEKNLFFWNWDFKIRDLKLCLFQSRPCLFESSSAATANIGWKMAKKSCFHPRNAFCTTFLKQWTNCLFCKNVFFPPKTCLIF